MIAAKVKAALAAVLAAVLALAGAYYAGKAVGEAQADAAHLVTLNELNVAHGEHLRLAEARARREERALHLAVYQIGAKLEEENNAAKDRISELTAQLRTGGVRVSVPVVRACKGSGGRPPSDPPALPGPVEEDRADLLPRDAEFLVRFAQRCDAVVRERNSLIDAYEAARASRTPEKQ